MAGRLLTILLLLISLVALNGCRTYIIPLDSFKKQFAGMNMGTFRTVRVRGPIGEVHTYRTFPVDTIYCLDKKGHPYWLKNSPALEIRFTDKYHHHTNFYFDQIFVSDSSITGSQSRFFSHVFIKTIPLDMVTKVEIQDGHKRFRYVND